MMIVTKVEQIRQSWIQYHLFRSCSISATSIALTAAGTFILLTFPVTSGHVEGTASDDRHKGQVLTDSLDAES